VVLNKNLAAILFDLDGTIFNLAVDWTKLATQLDKFADKTTESIATKIDTVFQLRIPEAVRLVENAEFAGVAAGAPTLGAADVLQTLHGHFKIAVVTRNTRAVAEAALAELSFVPDIIVSKEDVKKIKPDPESIQTALKLLGVSANKVILVGDTYHDVQAAHNAGLSCIIVDNPALEYQPKDADLYIETLYELSDHLVEQ